jgi:hypothetical protein
MIESLKRVENNSFDEKTVVFLIASQQSLIRDLTKQ